MLLLLRVVISLGVVLGLFWMMARTGSRKLGGRDRGLVRVRSRQALSRGSSLAVVEVGTRVLVVGVSDGGVRLLTEMDPAELASEPRVAEPVSRVVEPVSRVVEPVSRVVEPVETSYAEPRLVEPVETTEHPFHSYLAAEVSDLVTAAELAQPTQAMQPMHPAQPVHAAPRRTRAAAARPHGALAGSLLSGSTWRQAWDTATGRAYRSDDGDAA